jgi:hypothetical protein
MVATLAALGLDVHVQRSSTSRGRFVSLRTFDGKGGNARDGGTELDVDDEIWDTNPNPAALRDNARTRGGEGYTLPEEQFGYGEDTAYQGTAGQIGRQRLGERL